MVTPHFPPDSSAAAHRVRLLAPHLPEAGWTPTIVTLDPSAYEGRLDRDLEALVPSGLRDRARAGVAVGRDAAGRPRRSRSARVHRTAARLPARSWRANGSTRCSSRSIRSIRRCSAPGSRRNSACRSCSTIRIRGSARGASRSAAARTAGPTGRAARRGRSARGSSRAPSARRTRSWPFRRARSTASSSGCRRRRGCRTA